MTDKPIMSQFTDAYVRHHAWLSELTSVWVEPKCGQLKATSLLEDQRIQEIFNRNCHPWVEYTTAEFIGGEIKQKWW